MPPYRPDFTTKSPLQQLLQGKAFKDPSTDNGQEPGQPKMRATKRRLLEQRRKPLELLERSMQQRSQASLGSEIGSSSPVGNAVTIAHGDPKEGLTEHEFNQALQKMMGEAPGKITITSGKRDPQKQIELWEKALEKYGDPEIADNWVARPGTSKHETGLAADLSFADAATKQWFHENAGNYGLYFPMSHEPWHIQLDPKAAYWQQQTPQFSTGAGSAAVQNRSTGDQMLDYIIQNESGFDPTAQNPHSTAFGLGQMIIANRKAYGERLGYDPNTTDPNQQLHMMQEYIKDRYGTVENAYKFKKQHGWY